MRAFNFFSPETVEEALDLLSQHQDSIAVIAGGTDLIIDLNEGGKKPDYVLDISQLKELDYISESDGMLHIGANTTFATLEKNELISEYYPAIAKMADYMGSPQIRELGTVGGNVVSASVAGDSPTVFLAYDATVVLQSKRGTREMSIEEFNVNRGKFRCQIEDDELLIEVKIPQANSNFATAYRKFGKRKSLAIVVLATAMRIERDRDNRIKDARVTLGAVSLHPMRSPKIEKALIGKKLDMEELEPVLQLYTEEIDAAIASRPSVVYKREGIRGLAKGCMMDVLEQYGLV
ncbi:MAG: FAD binding domain-containing protein [Fastidiosipilaceae bacterium]|nr:xanthine dehydrogenase family protein subunit M [Clostridiaceae bacterium]